MLEKKPRNPVTLRLFFRNNERKKRQIEEKKLNVL